MFSKILNIFKRAIPKSLFVRFIFIIIIPTILAQIIATYVFYNKHWHSVSSNMALIFAKEINVVIRLYENNLPMNIIRQIQSDLSIYVAFYPDMIINKNSGKNYELDVLKTALKKTVKYPYIVYFLQSDNNQIQVEVQTDKGVLSFVTSRKRIDNPTTHIFILWMTGTATVFFAISLIVSRNQIRPMIRLARAAEQFGKGKSIKYFKPEGALEVRKASIEFFKMKERIEKQISQRTEMLAGVSHDLKTPLTRMKLQLEMIESKELDELKQDVDDMKNMLDAYLSFVSGHQSEESKLVNSKQFIESILEKYKNNNIIFLVDIEDTKINIMLNAFYRCLTNLIENALKYADQISINAYSINDNYIIDIEDNGPGIEKGKREDVFKPFYRIDPSRNLDIAGVGLGLAIAKDIITTHAGSIELLDSLRLKGLLVRITLPF